MLGWLCSVRIIAENTGNKVKDIQRLMVCLYRKIQLPEGFKRLVFFIGFSYGS